MMEAWLFAAMTLLHPCMRYDGVNEAVHELANHLVPQTKEHGLDCRYSTSKKELSVS
jgi:hypothetical protein